MASRNQLKIDLKFEPAQCPRAELEWRYGRFLDRVEVSRIAKNQVDVTVYYYPLEAVAANDPSLLAPWRLQPWAIQVPAGVLSW